MKKIKLTDKQIEIINDYVKEASQISRVSGICLYAFGTILTKDIHIVLQSILDFSLEYNDKLIGQKIPSEISDEEYDAFCNLSRIYETTSITEGERFCFGLSRMTDYCTQSANRISELVKLDLANSSILFDRFGDINAKREEILKFYQPDESYLQIENIDSVTGKQDFSVKKLQLKNKQN